MNPVLRLTVASTVVAVVATIAQISVSVQAATPHRIDAAQTALVRRLADESSIRQLIYHYGRGNDEVSIHHADRALARRRGAAEYAKAFTPDALIEVFALGNDKPIGKAAGIEAWTDFADKYYAGNGYSSTLHLMSNFEIAFEGADRANVSAFALAPHFFVRAAAKDASSADTVVEWMLCRYAYRAERQADGGWKIARLQINLEEIARTPGHFPVGQRDGR